MIYCLWLKYRYFVAGLAQQLLVDIGNLYCSIASHWFGIRSVVFKTTKVMLFIFLFNYCTIKSSSYWASPREKLSSGGCEHIRAVQSAPLLFAFWKVSYVNLLQVKFKCVDEQTKTQFVRNPEDRFS